jgi:hypothetical protein
MAQDTPFTETLKKRFHKHMHRHPGVSWDAVERRLELNPDKLESLHQLEDTGGEPDVIDIDPVTGLVRFFDFSAETPKGRRSICYDTAALESRKEYKPRNSAEGMAQEMGATLMTEAEYFQLQSIEPVDTKTSSWLATPADIREKGGAIFGDRRFGRVFIYHNGAESYYSVRGFRAVLTV